MGLPELKVHQEDCRSQAGTSRGGDCDPLRHDLLPSFMEAFPEHAPPVGRKRGR